LGDLKSGLKHPAAMREERCYVSKRGMKTYDTSRAPVGNKRIV
jgi:hypothetical protein